MANQACIVRKGVKLMKVGVRELGVETWLDGRVLASVWLVRPSELCALRQRWVVRGLGRTFLYLSIYLSCTRVSVFLNTGIAKSTP